MTKGKVRAISLLALLSLLLGLGACTAPAEEATPAPEATQTPAPTEAPAEEDIEPVSERTLAEKAIIAGLDYSNHNFIREKDFYAALTELLALRDLELAPYGGDNAYYCFNYSNIEGVKLLTVAKTMEEIEADRAQAGIELAERQAEFQAEREALQRGEKYVAPEKEEEPEAEITFDGTKDVANSEDFVTSFVISAGQSEADQQLLFVTAAAAWCIMSPKYDNTDDAFAYMWRALYNTYVTTTGDSASTIDGIDSSYSFTIPGNGVEGWIGTDEAGNYIVAITMYPEYDEIIDVEPATGLPPGMVMG